jgi:preprotein translocase subunit SecG
MYTTLIVLLIIAAILLILVVLIQNPKGGGLSGEFGGATSQMFGVQRSADLMEQITWGAFAFILVGALLSATLVNKGGSDQYNVEKAQARPAATAPATPATAPATPTTTTPAGK